jgi:hypothetical protein
MQAFGDLKAGVVSRNWVDNLCSMGGAYIAHFAM